MKFNIAKKDHKLVKQLFKEFRKAHAAEDTEACAEIARRTCDELEVHTTIEEEIFYPAVRELLGKDEELVEEAEVEHWTARDLITQLKQSEGEDMRFAAIYKVLSEYVLHHANEEEKEMFPKLSKHGAELKPLGAQMMERKQDLMAEKGMED